MTLSASAPRAGTASCAVVAGYTGSIENTVTVASSTFDPNPANNQVTVQTPATEDASVNRADLAIALLKAAA